MAFAEMLGGLLKPVHGAEVPFSTKPQIADVFRDLTNATDPQHIRGFRYENLGVAYLEATTPSEHFIVGPTLIEKSLCYGLPTGKNDPEIKLPDAMIFKPVGDYYVLEEVIEFKAGLARYKSAEKLRGFKNLFEYLRGHPTHLNSHISAALHERDMPRLFIPKVDYDIEVHFVSPRPNLEDLPFHDDTDFRVFYWTLPEQQAA